MSRFPSHPLWIALLLLLLAGCTATVEQAPEEAIDEGPVAQALRQAAEQAAVGEYDAALATYQQLALTRPFPESLDYRLLRVDTLIVAGRELLAQAELVELGLQPLTPSQRLLHQILSARLHLEDDPDRALELLARPAADESAIADTALLGRFHQLRQEAYSATGNHLEAAREGILREFYLIDRSRIASNQFSIWQSLSQLSLQTLRQLQIEPPPDLLSGWLELAQIIRDNNQTRLSLQEQMAGWHRRYPQHPLLLEVEQQLLERNVTISSSPRQVALLLPVSGRFAKAAETIRDAIIAANFQQGAGAPTIRLYDSGDQNVSINALYDRAVDEGAEFIVGPLNKQALTQLAQRAALPVTTLALNSYELAGPAQLYQFSLSPEDEAASAAERAWAEGHSNAAILVPNTELGQRIADSFSTHWLALGGKVIATERYDQKQSDYSRPIKRMLAIDGSNNRKRQLSGLLRQPLEFTPRIRQDIDFIFVMAHPRQGRLLRPQLRFHHASRLPVYATSHIYSGQVDQDRDRDLDGIQFSDMPWTLSTSTKRQLSAEERAALARYQGGLQRLVAFGLDAHALIQELPRLALYPTDSFQGATGTLSVPEGTQISRRLDWARFQAGRPKPLPRMEREENGTMELAPNAASASGSRR